MYSPVRNIFANFPALKVLARSASGLLLAATCLLGGQAQANIALEPLIISTQSERGQAASTLTLRNTSAEPLRVRVYSQPFTYNADGFEGLEESLNDLSPYLQFSPRELLIPPGGERQVRLIARLPESLPAGEYRATLFTETLIQSTDESDIVVNLEARIGATFYVQQGETAPEITIANASWNGDTDQIQLRVTNSGNATVFPKTNWTLLQNGAAVASGNVDRTTVIAEGERNILLEYPGEGNAPLPAGQYQLTGELTWGEGSEQVSIPFDFPLSIPATPGS